MNAPKNNRFVWLMVIFTLVLSLFMVSERRGESGISDMIPPSWRPSVIEKGKKADLVNVEGPVLDLQDSFARVAAQMKPAVVSITATHVETVRAEPEQFYFGDPFEDFFREFNGRPQDRRRAPPRHYERRQQGMGSGVVVDPRGYILTNEHVVREADELTITFQAPEEKKYAGKVVGSDPRSDLAVIKIEPKTPLTYAVLGDSDKVRVGDWAIAVGSPFGLEQTVTVGVISAMRQSLNIEGVSYSGLLQTDAAINRGNSGGPLVNIRGEVVGINTAIYAPTGVFAGIGFAIPSNRVKEIMEQLIEKGHVVRGWMGVEIVAVNEVMAQHYGLKKPEGVMVNLVQPGSPAEKAGLTRGDVIVMFNGTPTPDPVVLRDIVGRTPPKTTVKMDVVRDGKKIPLTLTTVEMPSETGAKTGEAEGDSSDEGTPGEWEGALLSPLTPPWAQRLGVPTGTDGVIVTEIQPGGLAERLGLDQGDVIVSVNRKPTPTVGTFMDAVKSISSKEGVLLDIIRRGRSLFLSYRDGQ
jgi:serine protease Do